MQPNKAARQSLVDHLTSEQAGFDAANVSMFGTNPVPKKHPKPPKARFVFIAFQISATYIFQVVHC